MTALRPPQRLGDRACSCCSRCCSSSPGSIQPNYGANRLRLAGARRAALSPSPWRRRRCVVIAGGIDLSIASMMALTSVTAAVLMDGASEEFAIVVVPLMLLLGFALGAINGVADRHHPRPRHRRDAGHAVRLAGRWRCSSSQSPGGAAARLAQGADRRHGGDPGRAGEITAWIPMRWCCSWCCWRWCGFRSSARSSASRSMPSARATSPPSAAASPVGADQDHRLRHRRPVRRDGRAGR